MVKIICQFCGANVNVSEDHLCPNCGASLADNEQLQNLRKMAAERNALNLEHEKLRKERIKNQVESEKQVAKARNGFYKFITGIRIAGLLFLVFFLGSAFLSAFGVFDSNDSNDSYLEETEYVEPFHAAQFGETVVARDYTIALTDWDYYTPNSYAIHDDEIYVKFYFTYTNTTNEKVYDDTDIYCYLENGKECDNQWSISDSDRQAKFDSQTVMPGKSYSGWIYFTIPKGETRLTVMYGESVEFSVDLGK